MTRTRRVAPRWILCSLVCSLASSAQVADAQAVAADGKAAAEALFDQGLALMQKGDFASGCVKLEQSQSIDRGIGTMLYLAECYEKSGRTASAWALFRQAASEAAATGASERAEAGRQRAERLTPLLSKLTIQVSTPALAGLELTRNGAPVPSSLWGVATPVDPGEHTIEARAVGYSAWVGSVHVGSNAGDSASLVVPALAPAVSSAPPSASSAPLAVSEANAAASSAPVNEPVDRALSDDTSGSTQRIVGLVLGGAGVVAIGVGAVFGVQAMSKNNDAEEHCPNGGAICVDTKGVSLTEDAQSAASLSNVFVIGGAVLAAAGVVVYLLAPTHEEPSIALRGDAHGVRATLGGVF